MFSPHGRWSAVHEGEVRIYAQVHKCNLEIWSSQILLINVPTNKRGTKIFMQICLHKRKANRLYYIANRYFVGTETIFTGCDNAFLWFLLISLCYSSLTLCCCLSDYDLLFPVTINGVSFCHHQNTGAGDHSPMTMTIRKTFVIVNSKICNELININGNYGLVISLNCFAGDATPRYG